MRRMLLPWCSVPGRIGLLFAALVRTKLDVCCYSQIDMRVALHHGCMPLASQTHALTCAASCNAGRVRHHGHRGYDTTLLHIDREQLPVRLHVSTQRQHRQQRPDSTFGPALLCPVPWMCTNAPRWAPINRGLCKKSAEKGKESLQWSAPSSHHIHPWRIPCGVDTPSSQPGVAERDAIWSDVIWGWGRGRGNHDDHKIAGLGVIGICQFAVTVRYIPLPAANQAHVHAPSIGAILYLVTITANMHLQHWCNWPRVHTWMQELMRSWAWRVWKCTSKAPVSECIGSIFIVIARGHLLQSLLYSSHIVRGVAPALKQSYPRARPRNSCKYRAWWFWPSYRVGILTPRKQSQHYLHMHAALYMNTLRLWHDCTAPARQACTFPNWNSLLQVQA